MEELCKSALCLCKERCAKPTRFIVEYPDEPFVVELMAKHVNWLESFRKTAAEAHISDKTYAKFLSHFCQLGVDAPVMSERFDSDTTDQLGWTESEQRLYNRAVWHVLRSVGIDIKELRMHVNRDALAVDGYEKHLTKRYAIMLIRHFLLDPQPYDRYDKWI